MNYDNPELHRRLAAEYALGTLRGAARRRFERLLVRDPELQARVARWEERLAGMAWTAAPETRVPERIWTTISGHLEAAGSTTRRRGLWNSLAFWRGVGFAATAVALALLVLPVDPPIRAPDAMPERVAMIAESGSDAMGWVVTAAAGGQQIRVRALSPPEMPEGEVCVLWLVWPDGVVRAVGVLPEYGERTLAMPIMDRQPYQAQVAVTIERVSDIPMDSPAGPHVYRGPWMEI
jgi:anti-sigma-K factor RskA